MQILSLVEHVCFCAISSKDSIQVAIFEFSHNRLKGKKGNQNKESLMLIREKKWWIKKAKERLSEQKSIKIEKDGQRN